MEFNTDVVIGLEIHLELATDTKLFCSCSTHGSDEPNTRTCPVCLGHPGSKPVLNKKAVEYAIKLALALESDIASELVFSRKSYFYPDMSKNYQISQYELPLASNGKVRLSSGKEIRLTRLHMEEDPASLVHPAGMQNSNHVLVDYNRSGDPLVEIVTEPDMASPEEAREFMKKLISVVEYLEIFDINRCIVKADANVSIKEGGYVRSEIKNVTGFKEIEKALFYEVARQKEAVKNSESLVMDTRTWDTNAGITKRVRIKETEADYGYIIDPDLVITDISSLWVEKIRQDIPELAEEKAKRYVDELKLSEVDAEVISAEKKLAWLFEKVAEKIDPLLAAKWLRRELVRVMNYNKKEYEDLEIDENHLIDLLKLVEEKKITDNTARKIMERLMDEPFNVYQYVKEQGLEAVSDTGELEKFCKEVIDENPSAVQDYKNGTQKSFNFLVGQVMRKTKGKATPAEVTELLKKLIG